MKQRRILSRILFLIFLVLVVLSACNNPQPTTPSLIKGNANFNKLKSNGLRIKDEVCSTSSAIATASDLIFIQPNGHCQAPSLPLQIESPIGRPRVSYLSSDSTTISVNPYPLAIINFDWDGHSYSTTRLNNESSSLIFAYYGLGLACDSCSGSISEEDRYDGKYITVTFGGKTKPYSNPYSCSEVGEYIKLDSFSATFKVSCEKPIPTPTPTITPTPEPSPTNECGGNGNSGGGGFGTKSINNNGTLLPSNLTPLISSTQNLLSPAQDISDKSSQYNKILTQINNTQNQLNTLSSLPSTKARELKKQEIQAKLNNLIAQRDSLSQQINSSLSNLDTQKNNLRNSVNNILGDNSSQDSNDKPIDLQSYKDRIEELESNFDDSVDSENTYGLVDATNTIADESKLYADLVRDYTSSLLSNSVAETLADDPDLTSIDKLTKPVQVIHYLNNRIKEQNDKLIEQSGIIEALYKEIPNLTDLSNDMESITSETDALLEGTNLTVSSFKTSGFHISSFDHDQKLPLREAQMLDRLRNVWADTKANIKDYERLYSEKLNDIKNLKGMQSNGIKTTPEGKPIKDAIKESGQQLNGIKSTLKGLNKQAKAYKVKVDNKLTDVNNSCKAQACNDQNVNWFPHGNKHVPQPNKTWDEIIESTTHGDAKYNPNVNIKNLEIDAWKTGLKTTNGRDWKVKEYPNVIGAKNGNETNWVRIEHTSGNVIHGHPITHNEYLTYLK